MTGEVESSMREPVKLNPAIVQHVPLDHVIFYVGFDLLEIASWFRRFGFTLTPLGRHSTGSVNQLAILDSVYIELIGFESGTPPTVRPELQRQSPGLNGIVLREDVDDEKKLASNLQCNAPMLLERPVEIGQEKGVARFRITTLRETARNFRVFLCHHFTPQFVWRPEWKVHDNGVFGIASIRLKTDEAKLIRGMLATADKAVSSEEKTTANELIEVSIEELSPPDTGWPQADERSAVRLLTRDLAGVVSVFKRNGVAYRMLGESEVAVSLPEPLDAHLVFVQHRAA